jgi:uncharacterized protein YjeT (DUF2065 family)
MSPEVILSLCLLVPLLYAGLYMLTTPSHSIRVVNKILADTHRMEASILMGELFPEPRPIVDSLKTRTWLRCAGLAVMAAGLFRLYSL